MYAQEMKLPEGKKMRGVYLRKPRSRVLLVVTG